MTRGALPLWRRSGRLALLALVLVVYGLEAHTRRALVPAPATQGDQDAYLRYAREMHDTNYTVIGGRNRMPVFPFLLSHLYRQGMSEDEFLSRAQAFNINLSIAILAALFFIYRRHFPAYYSAALLAATAFGVFLYRAVFVQTEVLFYFLSFCLFLSLWRMLVAPSARLALWTGGVAALSHLTKASVLPGVALFGIIAAAQIVPGLRSNTATAAENRWRRPFLLALVLTTFLVGILPYITTSKQIFGQYFYNVNSTFYIWCDSWEEVKTLTRAHRDRFGWPAMPPDQIPSARKYWREHSISQISGRVAHGFVQILTNNAQPRGYYKYALAILATAVWVAWRRRSELRSLLVAQFYPALFVGLFLAGYLLLFAWYEPLSGHSRFLLSLFLPFTFAASKIIARLGEDVRVQIAGRPIGPLPLLATVLLVFAVSDAVYNAFRPDHPTLS